MNRIEGKDENGWVIKDENGWVKGRIKGREWISRKDENGWVKKDENGWVERKNERMGMDK